MRSAFLITSLLAAAASAETAPQPPPNVVIVVADDLGWADLGCYGSELHRTPRIDRLAAEGARFTSAYAAAAVCSPTRASILTGRHPVRTGVTDWIRPLDPGPWSEAEVRAAPPDLDDPRRALLTPRNPRWMEHEEVTLAELLRPLGYATGFVGKWHLGPSGWHPEDQGFTVNVGGCDLGHPPHYFDPYPPRHQRRTFPNLAPRRAGEYLTDREADEAVRFVRESADGPFLLCLWHYAVHAPIQAKPELIEQYRPAAGEGHDPAYAAMVQSLDEALGAVLDELERLGLDERTIVIFTSDNGGADHLGVTDNGPLRSGKGRPHEGGVRVPLIVRWPGRIPADTRCDVPVCSVDLLPTICAAASVALPPVEIDGVDLLPLLGASGSPGAGGSLEQRPLFWHYPHYWWGGRLTPYSSMRLGRWKLIRWYESGAQELFDLQADPGETTDLAAERPAVLEELSARLDGWLAATRARIPRPRGGRDAGG